MDFSFPGAKMSNFTVPRPSGSVIGPPRMKMPEKAGDLMPRSGHKFPHSALGFQTKLLPQNPMMPVSPGMGLISTNGSGPSGLNGIKRKR